MTYIVLTLSRSYLISIRAGVLAKKGYEQMEDVREVMTYLDTGGAAQYASMVLAYDE